MEFYFYVQDNSFDYGQGYYLDKDYHGFIIDIDDNNKVKIESLEACGDYEEMNNIKTLPELKQYLIEHLNEVQGKDNKKDFEKLIAIL